ncbi:CMP-N-acetylneuraminic acid synthetase [Rummeliibacillus sp. G93]|uniref:PseG/SpsG family protein n=1 Tax=Rummeliibacillus sp. G93 TaxID=2939494 RepID=UPI00201BB5F6|nr:CMP-N-acetylneuraminic acid synthetase [Rummeliibacillus sp. G93]UQW97645.1 CMP-N-acetylneuraminic acid synthetase [Rummeliibacillus sp. G93]
MNYQNNEESMKKTVFVGAVTSCMNLYPIERIATLAAMFDKSNTNLLIKHDQQTIEYLINKGFKPISYQTEKELVAELKKLSPQLVIYDGGNTEVPFVEELKAFIPTIIHFDDFGEGGTAADCVFQTLYQEKREKLLPHYLVGPSSYVVPKSLQAVQKKAKEPADKPHIVVSIEGKDPDNTSYRVLRHLLQLQIPIRISVVVQSNYSHAVDELKLMALSRKNIKVIHKDHALYELLGEADIVICGAKYTPYKVATVGIPCIVVCYDELEMQHIFPTEANGFINLGLGKKIKQSLLQNAVMEFLLHEGRREHAIRKQLSHDVGRNNQYIQSFIKSFGNDPSNSPGFLSEEQAKKTSDMIQ